MGKERTYYGEYRSSTAGVTGCTNGFVSDGRDNLLFPPQVSYHCDVCGHTHGFRLAFTHQIATPSQERNFAAYCAATDLTRSVEVPARQ